MKMNLLCPKCGFAFGALVPDNLSKEEVEEIMTCPCGTMMIKTGHLFGIPIGDAREAKR